MSESDPNQQNPGLRIKQIDAEMTELKSEMKRVSEGKDAASARSRAQLNERMQQLKAEQNKLMMQQDASDR